jgi:hypothetical protein
MTSTPAATSEMDLLDQLGAKAFDGFLVRKDSVRKYSRRASPARSGAAGAVAAAGA